MIKQYNLFLVNAELNLIRTYEIVTILGVYTNLVLSCSLQTQKLILQRGHLLIGLSQCRVFENVYFAVPSMLFIWSLLKKLSIHDYLQKLCRSSLSQSLYSNYINCVKENVKLAKNKSPLLNTGHRANDERCKCRINRINGLKHYFLNK